MKMMIKLDRYDVARNDELSNDDVVVYDVTRSFYSGVPNVITHVMAFTSGSLGFGWVDGLEFIVIYSKTEFSNIILLDNIPECGLFIDIDHFWYSSLIQRANCAL